MIRLRILGPTCLEDGAGAAIHSTLAQPKRLALLAYLATSGGFVRRDTLLGLFWPEQDESRARGALAQAIHYLRRSLGEAALVARGPQEVGVAETALWCDAAAFERALEAGEPEAALELYRGDLLPGFFLPDVPELERWLDGRRTALRTRAADAAWTLAEVAERTGDAAEAARRAKQAQALDPDSEVGARRLLALLDRTGERAAALQAYDAFCARLAREYGASAAPETEALVAGIRARVKPATVEVSALAQAAAQVAPGALSAESSAKESALPVVAVPVPARGRARVPPGARWAAALLATCVPLAAAGAWALARHAPGDGPSQAAAIVVLPFADLSQSRDKGYLADGLTEEMIDALARLPRIRVVARSSAFQFKGRSLDVRDVGRRLGVDAALEGSVRSDGSRLRVTVQLVDAKSGFHRWSRSYDREAADVFALEDDIGRDVVAALGAGLMGAAGGEATGPASARPATRSAAAHDLYLRGRHLMRMSASGVEVFTTPLPPEERVRRAIEYLQGAVRADSAYAAAQAELARAWMALAEYAPAASVAPGARAAALRAVALDGRSAVAHRALADILFHLDWDWSGAEAEYRRALALDAPDAESHAALAAFLTAGHRYPEALQEERRALDLERAQTVDTIAFQIHEAIRLADPYRELGDDRRSLDYLHRALALDPDFAGAHFALGMRYLYDTHEYALAGREMQRTRELAGDLPPFLAYEAAAFAYAGNARRARAMVDTMTALRPTAGLPGEELAVVELALGRPQRAISWLEKAADEHHWHMVYLDAYPTFAALRREPRYQRLLRRIGVPPLPGRAPLAAAAVPGRAR